VFSAREFTQREEEEGCLVSFDEEADLEEEDEALEDEDEDEDDDDDEEEDEDEEEEEDSSEPRRVERRRVGQRQAYSSFEVATSLRSSERRRRNETR
jgi:hypothetical protein